MKIILILFLVMSLKIGYTQSDKTSSLNSEISPRLKSEKSLKQYENLGFEETIKIAKQKDKNILFYFTSSSCLNSKKMEDRILFKPEILKILKEDFVFILLNVEDRTLVKSTEQTYGSKNIDYEKDKFKSNSQPMFFVVNSKGETISKTGYVIYDKFLEFLTKNKI